MDVDAELAAISALEDPLEWTPRAHQLVTKLNEVSSEATRLRRAGIEALTHKGMNHTEIGETIGAPRARVSQLLRSGPSPERALLSPDGGPVTVALGSKESQVGDQPTTDMISRDATLAYDSLRDALDGYGVKCRQEIIGAPGLKLEFNRDRLIVIGSPKVLPFAGQIMASDPNFAFGGTEEEGRYLIERPTGNVWYSPADSKKSADIAYVGRLPRPDGKGPFLYIAGIHAAGTHGAVQHVLDNMGELYKTVGKERLFSLAVRAEYKTEQRTITRTEALTDIYTR